MKKLLTCLIIITTLAFQSAKAQQLPLFSQYLFNGFLINPAYAGLDGLSTIDLVAREQWVGIPNAPKTHMVSFQTRLLPESFVGRSAAVRRRMMSRFTSGRVGLGVLVYNDMTGVITRNGFQFTYAYHMPFGDGQTFSMALTGSMSQFFINRNSLQLASTNDNLINKNGLNMWLPDMGVGFVYSSNTFYAGLAADQLFQAYLQLGGIKDPQYRLYRQYNLTMGYRLPVGGQGTVFEPSLLLKTAQSFTSQLDITGKVHFPNDFWVGLSYRTGNALVVMTGVVLNQFTVGYSFDYNMNSLGNQTYGTHEIMAAYKFGNNPSRLRWLNR